MVSQELKSSAERIGQLYPILVDYFGNVIDGEHRFGVDEKWRRVRLEHIRTEKDRLIARIVSNTVRRSVPSKEKTELLERLGEIYSSEGVKPGRIAYKIADETGMSYTWVMKYLPDRFKDSLQSERAGAATQRVTRILDELLRPPKRKGALKIKDYTNTDFVVLMLEEHFYEEFERDSLELGVPTELSVLKALEVHHEKMRKAIAIKNKNKPS
ncbi:MAG: hypothetical protein JRE40_12445 [Deltaproteobacteria bacterium]|nr:hypothetical protein [Deltaproteobacteria bacterium]